MIHLEFEIFETMVEQVSANMYVPANANEGCPGTQDQSAGKADACGGCPNQAVCASDYIPANANVGCPGARNE